MIERIKWHDPRANEFRSPFLRGRHERPLRITFYSSSLLNLSGVEAEALEALLALSNLPEIEPLQTESGTFPTIEIGNYDSNSSSIPVSVHYNDGRRCLTGIPFPEQWSKIALNLVRTDFNDSTSGELLKDLIILRAHFSLAQDIFITSSPLLLKQHAKPFIREANPRLPSEAAQIVGLFLRSRGNYTYHAEKNVKLTCDRGLFYWSLVRHRLPGMWRFFSACVQAENVRRDNISNLGESILVRCVRAMQARDAIGEQFYILQNNNTRDSMMYQFDYLTLVLAGALDAQARIVHRAYRIKKPKEWNSSFYMSSKAGREFLEAIKQSGGQELFDVVSDQHSQDVMSLLYPIRNTIHGASPLTLAFQSSGQLEESFVEVPLVSMWESAERCGSVERWGMSRIHTMVFEPYTYSCVLVEEVLKLINAIADATDVRKFFPDGNSIPELIMNAPENGMFAEHVRKRLAVLG